MKTLLAFLAFPLVLATATAQNKGGDPFEEGMRQAYADYKKGDNEAVATKLKELLKLVEERGANKVAELLPPGFDGWRGETLKREDLGLLGGGICISRVYVSGKKQITVKVIKDSPLAKQLLPLFTNEELLRVSNRKTQTISSETGIMEGENKMKMVLDKRIYLELAGNAGVMEKDILTIARKLDLPSLAKLK